MKTSFKKAMKFSQKDICLGAFTPAGFARRGGGFVQGCMSCYR